MAKANDRMDPYFSVFNLHVKQAGKRADREFRAAFGDDAFKAYIRPLHEKGIMLIFNSKPRTVEDAMYRGAYVALVTAYANEGVRYRLRKLER